jgi:predicted nucleic acid-binding protein
MARYVIGPDVALALAEHRSTIAKGHRLLAPTLLRSQVLAWLYAEVRAGALGQREADQRLDHLRRLRIRLLGDRSLQQVAWKTAAQFGWSDTFVAEYVALTRLQGDALVLRDAALARAVAPVVKTATLDELLA